MNDKVIISIVTIVILLGIATFFFFSSSSNSNDQTQYQIPTLNGNTSNSALNGFAGLNVSPTSQQTENIPSSSTDIPSP